MHICIVILVICAAAGGADVESRWCGSGQLPLLPGRQGPQQKLQDIAPGFFSLCLAHPKHGGKVRQDMDKHIKTCITSFCNLEDILKFSSSYLEQKNSEQTSLFCLVEA